MHLITVDWSVPPCIPEGCTIQYHSYPYARKSLFSVELFHPSNKAIAGRYFYHLVQNKNPCAANLLDRFLAQPEKIPSYFKGKDRVIYTFFWGTIYMNSALEYCVRGMYFEDVWKECLYTFCPDPERDEYWPSNCVALVAA